MELSNLIPTGRGLARTPLASRQRASADGENRAPNKRKASPVSEYQHTEKISRPTAQITGDDRPSKTRSTDWSERRAEKLARTPIAKLPLDLEEVPGRTADAVYSDGTVQTPVVSTRSFAAVEKLARTPIGAAYQSSRQHQPNPTPRLRPVQLRRRVSFGRSAFEALHDFGDTAPEKVKDAAMIEHVQNMQAYSHYRNELNAVQRKLKTAQQTKEALGGQLTKIDADAEQRCFDKHHVNITLNEHTLFEGDIFTAPIAIISGRATDIARKASQISVAAELMESEVENIRCDMLTTENTQRNVLNGVREEQRSLKSTLVEQHERVSALQMEYVRATRLFDVVLEEKLHEVDTNIAHLVGQRDQIAAGVGVQSVQEAILDTLTGRAYSFVDRFVYIQQAQALLNAF